MHVDPESTALELSEQEMMLYARQILLDDWDIDAQERLKLSNVLIVGCGGIGCLTAELLARAGVGKISLIDGDKIEISNLQRQIAFDPQHLGFYKAEILAKRLQQINPYIDVFCYPEYLSEQHAEKLFQHQDLILDGCDNFKTRYLVNRLAKLLQIPLISASAIGLQGQLFAVEGDSACYACLFGTDDEDDRTGLRCADNGVLATTPNVMASLQAHHALLALGLNQYPLKQKLMVWNGLTMQSKVVNFAKDTECTVCHMSQSIQPE